MKSFLFTLGVNGDGLLEPMEVYVDTFAPLEGKYDFDYYISPNSEFHPVELDPTTYGNDSSIFEKIKLRARYANGSSWMTYSVFHVKTEHTELSREELEILIRNKHEQGNLKEFLQSAKIA